MTRSKMIQPRAQMSDLAVKVKSSASGAIQDRFTGSVGVWWERGLTWHFPGHPPEVGFRDGGRWNPKWQYPLPQTGHPEEAKAG